MGFRPAASQTTSETTSQPHSQPSPAQPNPAQPSPAQQPFPSPQPALATLASQPARVVKASLFFSKGYGRTVVAFCVVLV